MRGVHLVDGCDGCALEVLLRALIGSSRQGLGEEELDEPLSPSVQKQLLDGICGLQSVFWADIPPNIAISSASAHPELAQMLLTGLTAKLEQLLSIHCSYLESGDSSNKVPELPTCMMPGERVVVSGG